MRTLILAERPGRGLRSRMLLSLLPALFPDAGPLLLANSSPSAPEGFLALDPDAALPDVQRVVLAGAFEEPAQLARAFATARAAMAAGAVLETRVFSLARGAAPRDPPPGAELLEHAAVLEVREWFTMDRLMLWRIPAPAPRLVPYPERDLPADPSLCDGLPAGPILGIALHDSPAIRAAWATLLPVLRDRLALFPPGTPILPLPIEHPGLPEDDLPGSHALAAALLPDNPLLLPQLANAAWRRHQFTPGRLKALVARCALVITNQDVPAVLADACGVPVLGLALAKDRRIVTAISQLSTSLAPGSALLYPRPASSSAGA